MARIVTDAAEGAATFAASVLAILAGTLPRRTWRDLEERMPISSMVIPSALLAFFAGFAIGIPGFLRYAQETASTANTMMLEIAGKQLAHGTPHKDEVTTALPVGLTGISLIAFCLFTPTGLLAMYLAGSGLYRFLAAATDHPQGDPLLTAADGLWRGLGGRHARRRQAAAREKEEGPEVPDVLVTGPATGVPDADYVLVASRRKEGWDPGVYVVTEDVWYRIGTAFDRRYGGRLRTLYPLSQVRDLTVLRRGVRYDLPPVQDVATLRRRQSEEGA